MPSMTGRGIRGRIWAVVAGVLVILAAVAPVRAGSTADALDVLAAGARDRVAGIADHAQAIRSVLRHGNMTERVLGLLAAADGDTPVGPPLPQPQPSDLTAVLGVPAALRAPLAGLLAAVRHAAEMTGTVSAADVRRAARAISMGMLDGVRSAVPRTTLSLPFGEAPGTQESRETASPRSRALRGLLPTGEGVDRAAANARPAALLIARALDRYLPALETGPTAAPAAGNQPNPVRGCDLVYLPPDLCVGSAADNHYTEQTRLTIDLGGDDHYANTAAGVPFVPDGGTPAGCDLIAVSIDLSGDDRYTADQSRQCFNQVFVAQGSAGFFGVGMLLDMEGDDRYSPAVPLSVEGTLQVHAQGEGLGPGLGLLFDGSGSDRYVVEGPPTTEGTVAISAQGSGGIGGTGALIDLGSADDRYQVDAGVSEMAPEDGMTPARTVFAQGQGTSSAGVLLDDGGADAFRITSAARKVGVDAYPPLEGTPPAFLTGQGYGAAGLGLLLTGPGDTSYRMEATGEGLVWQIVSGQGMGSTGVGVLDDAGGNDAYVARSTMSYHRDIVIDDSCLDPDGTICDSAAATVSAARQTVTNFVEGQGGGSFGGAGLLADHGSGRDIYEGFTESALRVTLGDALTSPTSPPSLDVTGYDACCLVVQGAGRTGTGVLVDEGGTDSYEARVLTPTEASATSVHAEGTPDVIAFGQFHSFVGAQGAVSSSGAVGALLDLGGTRDRFLAEAANPVRTAPDPDGAFRVGHFWPAFQGASDQFLGGQAQFVTLASDPAIISSPSRGVCPPSAPGFRGYGTWTECRLAQGGPVNGSEQHYTVDGSGSTTMGLAPLAAGRAPFLAFTEDTPHTAPLDAHPDLAREVARAEVAARLLDPEGNPIEGATIHFDWEYACPGTPCGAPVEADVITLWNNAWQVDAVTGSDGVARARIPLWGSAQFVGQNPRFLHRWAATYDGAPGLFPRHALQPFAFVEG